MSRPASVPELDPIPENLLREPIEYIYADHFRQRYVCVLLDEIIADPADSQVPKRAAAVLTYVRHELSLHIADEEESLFPLLARRCKPEDRIDDALKLLAAEHERDQAMARALIAGLRKVAKGAAKQVRDDFLRVATAFGETQRRHLSWENTVVLSLARRRLSASDMEALGRAMAARRGLAYPE